MNISCVDTVFCCNVFNVFLCIVLEDVSSQAAHNIGVLSVYQVCLLPVPLDLFHMLSKFPKKNFVRKNVLDLVLFI